MLDSEKSCSFSIQKRKKNVCALFLASIDKVDLIQQSCPNCFAFFVRYGNVNYIDERHRHRYEVGVSDV